MSSQKDFIERLVGILNKAGVLYMLAGSLGSSFHGQPRATNDIDIVIDPTLGQLEKFLDLLGTDFYVSRPTAVEALYKKLSFNIIDNKSGWKADMMIKRNRPFSSEEFNRRESGDFMGMKLDVLSAEDAILSKLEWYKQTQSNQQFRDILGIIEVQSNGLDMDYLKNWARQLNVSEELKLLINEAKKIR